MFPAHRSSRSLRLLTAIAVLLSGLFGGLASFASAQEAPQLRITRTDVSRFPLIETTVQLRDAPINARGEAVDFSVSLNDTPLPVIESRATQTPGATMIITDLSSRMSAVDAGYATRFQLMQPMVSDLVSHLQSGDQRAGLLVVTETVTLAHNLTNDLGAIANTLARSNPELLFEPQPLAALNPAAPYPLDTAILEAFAELAGAPPEQLRTVVVFAAGDPERDLNSEAVRAALAAARAADQPVQLLIYSFSSDAEAIDRLRALTDDDAFTAVLADGQIPPPELKRRIFAHYAGLINRGALITLRVAAPEAAAGPAQLTVSGANAQATAEIAIPAMAPQVSLFVSDPLFEGVVQMAIRTDYAQTPVQRVEYLLNGLPLVESAAGPTFTHALDVADPAFQQRFPPGTYELVAAVQDAQGQVSRSQPQSVEIVTAAPPPGPNLAPLLIGIGALALVGGATGIVLNRRRPRTNAQPAPLVPDDEATQHYQPEPANNPLDDEATARAMLPDDEPTAQVDLDDERTAPVDVGALASKIHWTISVVSGDTAQPLELKPNQRNYDLGRVTRTRTPDLPLNHERVSRNHARIELLAGGPVLVVQESTHGTFFGQGKTALVAGDRQALSDGDVFWLSPDVQLHVTCKVDQ